MLQELYTYQKTTTTILLLGTGDNHSALHMSMLFHTLVIPKDRFWSSQVFYKKVTSLCFWSIVNYILRHLIVLKLFLKKEKQVKKSKTTCYYWNKFLSWMAPSLRKYSPSRKDTNSIYNTESKHTEHWACRDKNLYKSNLFPLREKPKFLSFFWYFTMYSWNFISLSGKL